MKSQRTLQLLHQGAVIKSYKVALGAQPVGAKERQGDHKTPEGEYVVDVKKSASQFYMALHISYPNAADRANARRRGVAPGGDVEIHGLGKKFGWVGSGHRVRDWTASPSPTKRSKRYGNSFRWERRWKSGRNRRISHR